MRRLVAFVVVLASVGSFFVIRADRASPSAVRARALSDALSRLRAKRFYALSLELETTSDSGVRRTISTAQVDEAQGATHAVLDIDGNGPIEIVTQQTICFLAIASGRASGEGPRWVRVNVGTVGGARGAGFGPLPDPMSVLESLAGAVTAAPAMKQAGGSLVRFHATAGALAARLGAQHAPEARVLYGFGARGVDGDVLLDRSGRPVRVRLRSGLGGRARLVATLRVEGVGRRVLIGLPPNDAIVSAPSVSAAVARVRTA